MGLLFKLHSGLDRAGSLGLLKSFYNSVKHTHQIDSILTHSKCIVDISNGTDFDINNRFEVGIGSRPATHPRIGRSKFATRAGSSVSHTGQNSAQIGPGSVVHIEGDFSMGDSYINSHARVVCGEKVTIGDGVAIAWNVEILDDDRHDIIIDGKKSQRRAPIEIQDNVWIGHDVSVHKGVTIHEGSVVASDSVVLSDIPPNTLAAGNPAEVVRENVDWKP
ncbi:acyltransferase [Haloarcula marina]|uniref:acyltransferase n=1 Tax=Haloarcula marina TaxID=2961574 RepID=UPI0020B89E96|nr:acyltransferase [Halomicroarcula marina]